jgi:transposase
MKKMEQLWQRVVLSDEQKVAGMTAIQKAILEASARVGRPDNGVIWRKQTGMGETIYFFSPDIAELILAELKAWNATPAQLPNLKPGFEKVPF